MSSSLELNGSARNVARSAARSGCAVAQACLHRLRNGPRRPDWNWTMELSTQVLRNQLAAGFAMSDIEQSRRYLDSLVIHSSVLSQVRITPYRGENFGGSWFVANGTAPGTTLLYLHGGGFAYYPKAHANLIAMVTLAARSRTFALDYRLTPEHRFPAQLEDAQNAYQWLLDEGADPNDVVIAGDSAGGNMALATLLVARDRGLPMPKLAVALSPPTDFEAAAVIEGCRTSLVDNEEFDWINRDMLLKWADWYCSPAQYRNPYVSPFYADLRGLAPIYIQAGRAEILYDSIEAFAVRAKREGADVTLDSWDGMNHDFQMFGARVPQSADALQRLGQALSSKP